MPPHILDPRSYERQGVDTDVCCSWNPFKQRRGLSAFIGDKPLVRLSGSLWPLPVGGTCRGAAQWSLYVEPFTLFRQSGMESGELGGDGNNWFWYA